MLQYCEKICLVVNIDDNEVLLSLLMEKHTQPSLKRRLGFLLAGAVASVAAAAGVTPSHVSASTELAVTVAPEYGLDKVATRLSIIENVGVVSRLPQILATPEAATELNKTAPKLTCVGSAGTVTVNGEYASEDDVLTMIFVFAAAPSVDKCTLSNTTYVQPTGDTVYPFSAAAKAELFGDPAKILAAANKRLKSAVPALRKSYQGSWTTGAAKRVDAALTKYTVKPALFAFEASSTSTKSMYILRPDNHNVRWVHLCQRLTDGRLACLRYNPVTNKSKLWVNYDSPNYFTQDLTQEPASA